MGPRQVARWLACPVFFVLAHWCLLARTRAVLAVVPLLWRVGGRGAAEVLPPYPKTKGQAFELGWHARFYALHCEGPQPQQPEACAEALRLAAAVVGAAEPLTGPVLSGMRAFIAELDAQQSTVDRVVGFFSFVNVVWLVSIVGLLATLGPCLAYLCGPVLLRCAKWLTTEVLQPVALALHRWGVWEAAAYLLAFLFSAQSCQYPAAQADAAIMVALTGSLAFAPCWMYSTSCHTTGSGDKEKFLLLSYALAAGVFAPLALLHDSQLLGFLTVLSAYGSLGFVFFAFGFGFAVGFDGRDALHRCAAASLALIAGFAGLRILGVNPAVLQPFGTAVMVLGNVMYFLALLIVSSGWRSQSAPYAVRQCAMLGSLLAAILVGSVFAMPSMTNTATTFLVLWLMEKQLEVDWRPGMGMVVTFLNFVFLYFAAHYLHTHPEHVVSLFDARGVYL